MSWKAVIMTIQWSIWGKGSKISPISTNIVDGILRVLNQLPQGDPAVDSAAAPYRIFNIGNNRPVSLLNFIETLEAALGIEAPKTFLPNCHTTPSWS